MDEAIAADGCGSLGQAMLAHLHGAGVREPLDLVAATCRDMTTGEALRIGQMVRCGRPVVSFSAETVDSNLGPSLLAVVTCVDTRGDVGVAVLGAPSVADVLSPIRLVWRDRSRVLLDAGVRERYGCQQD